MSLMLLLGGARSGKSALALRMARQWDGPVVFVATAEARDEEMRARIASHRTERPTGWETIEEPTDLLSALRRAGDQSLVVIDCLGIWLSNLLEAGTAPGAAEVLAEQLARKAAERTSPTVVVSNEVGLGLVPTTPLGRQFRDSLGRINVSFSAAADRVALVVAGRVLELKEAPL